MDVKELIELIETRPCMFIGELRLENLYHFINGFLFNNLQSGRANYFDLAFKKQFHQWVRNEIEIEEKIKFNKEQNYVYYINTLCKDEEKRIKTFFELSKRFFLKISNEMLSK